MLGSAIGISATFWAVKVGGMEEVLALLLFRVLMVVGLGVPFVVLNQVAKRRDSALREFESDKGLKGGLLIDPEMV